MVSCPILTLVLAQSTEAGWLVASAQACQRIHHLSFDALHGFFILLAIPGCNAMHLKNYIGVIVLSFASF